jgi:hypothetical protein
MQQLPGTSCRACCFQSDSFLDTMRSYMSTQQSWFNGLCGFFNWMRGTPGWMNTYARNDWGNRALAVAKIGHPALSWGAGSAMCNLGPPSLRLTYISSTLAWQSNFAIRLWAVRDDIKDRDVAPGEGLVPTTDYHPLVVRCQSWSYGLILRLGVTMHEHVEGAECGLVSDTRIQIRCKGI